MAKKRRLIDKNGVQICPVTHIKAVYNNNGETLDAILSLINSLKADKSNTYTKTEVNNLIIGIGNSVILGELPETGVENRIYRVPGTGSYSDWAWNGEEFVKLAEYTGNVFVQISESAYDALSDEEKNDGTWYFVEEE